MQNSRRKRRERGVVWFAVWIFLVFLTGSAVAEMTEDEKNDGMAGDEKGVGCLDGGASMCGRAPFVQPGDVNGDGWLTLDDSANALNIIADVTIGKICQGADMNGDGRLGVVEALSVLQGRTPERTTRLLTDLNDTFSGPEPSAVVEFDGGVFYAATHTLHGRELFRYDLKTGETRMVKDICPGPPGSVPGNLTLWNGALYFSADDGGSCGRELWRTDGTEKGTSLVYDVNPGPSGSSPYALTVLISAAPRVNCLFFMADAGDGGRKIWALESDGTQPQAVFDIPESNMMGFVYSLAPRNLVVFRGALYFIPQLHAELHKINIQKEGNPLNPDFIYIAETVADLPSAAGGLMVWPAKDVMIFRANQKEIWQTDGAAAGTGRIDHTAKSHNPGGFTPMGDAFYFSARDESNYRKLWRVTGSMTLEKMIDAAGQEILEPESLTVFEERLFFSALDFEFGRELWQCDGTKDGTFRISDINTAGDAAPRELTPMGDALYFTATDLALSREEAGRELWRYTDTAPELAANILPGTNDSDPVLLTPVSNDKLFFAACNAPSEPKKLLYYDAAEGRTYVADDQNGKNASSGPKQFVSMNGDLYFVGQKDGGDHLWKKETSAAAATPVASLPSSAGTPIIVNGDRLYFTSRFYNPSNEAYAYGVLFSSDGTATGTQPVENSPENITEIAVMGGNLYFPGWDDQTGKELWTSDGTTAVLVKDILDFSWDGMAFSSAPAALTKAGQNVFFIAKDASHGSELWRSDGTTGGTVMLTNADPDLSTSLIGAVDSRLFFTARSDTYGLVALWSSDGTAAGTEKIKDMEFGYALNIRDWAVLGNTLYFCAHDSSGYELWKSDGTEDGTLKVTNIHDAGSSWPHEFTTMDGNVYFAATHADQGTELWKTDGTSDGTALVADIHPSGDSDPEELTVAGNLLFFTADDGTSGRELWVCDGSEVKMAGDILPGSESSNPTHLTDILGWLVFSADDGIHGREPWVY